MARFHRNRSLQLTIGMTGLQMPASPALETMHKLEVESASSTSLQNSAPYYNSSSHGSSIDTVSLLRGQPRYTNTSHPHLTNNVKRQDDAFNQVPKRFSQFILDQQNPYVAQRLDNLSLNSLTVSENLRKPRHQRLTYSRASRQKLAANPSVNTSGVAVSGLARSSTNISESMGSQATIFSTRNHLVNRRTTKRRHRPQLYASDATSLSRHNAVRQKQGGWLYRLRIRLARLAKKLKFRFFASSKRTGSIKRRRPISQPRLIKPPTTLMNGNHRNMRDIQRAIPYEKVPTQDPVQFRPPQIQAELQKPQLPETAQQSYEPQPYPARIALSSSENSTPPPVPPHLVRRSLTAPIVDETNDTIELWRQYLAQVVCRRVLLRQEINQFQAYLAGQDPLLNRLDVIRSKTPRASFHAVVKESVDSDSDYETVSESASSEASASSKGSEFSQNVLHRRSMLGEMLDYDSDGLSVSSNGSNSAQSEMSELVSQSVSHSNSVFTSSNLSINKRYGTVRRHKPTQSYASVGSLRRSPGIQANLSST